MIAASGKGERRRRKITREVCLLFPAGLLVATLLSMGGPEDGRRDRGLLTAGFGRTIPATVGRHGIYGGEQESGGPRKLEIRVPSVERALVSSQEVPDEITVSKSSGVYEVDFSARRRSWKYLTREVRAQIDAASIDRGRWKYVVVHNSATERGNAKVFDYYHRQVRGLTDGLAYHFVIGNGSYSGKGEIEVGQRWLGQVDGWHLQDESRDRAAIGVCLVGDFNKDKVQQAQLEALDELIDYLKAKAGAIELATHDQLHSDSLSCPGRYFPDYVLKEG